MNSINAQSELDDDLAAALAAAIAEGTTPPGRAWIVNRVIERIAAVVAAEPNASDRECDSLLFLLEAADQHCWRLDAFPPA